MARVRSPFTSPAVEAAIVNLRRPRMPPSDVRFAMLRDPDDPQAKPLVFADLDRLTRHIDQAREGKAVQLVDAPLTFRNLGQLQGVSVWTLAQDGARERFLGWYYVAGGSWRVLFAALPQGPVGARLRQARAA